MKKIQPTVSIIIVQYKVKELMFECLRSLTQKIKKVSYEVIVVDNDDKKHIKSDLLKEFPQVIYIPNENRGFGQGNNVGVVKATGEYVFFLNPDTTISPNTIESLATFLDKNEDVGIAAPLLMHADKKLFDLQGLGMLTPLRGIIALSFINKLFPKNPISKKYWLPEWDRTKVKEVDAVPGTAFMMRRDLYNKIGGFDDTFFLYFEEFDLCKRVKELGFRVCMVPSAKIIHLWGKSTEQRSDINDVFQQSRFYFFKKHYGIFNALAVELFTRASKEAILLTVILLFSSLIQMLSLLRNMIFIGDQAWFYISARDLLLGKGIPLVGITSSHTWLHQGPLWTYLLAVSLWLGRFDPRAGGYLSVGITLLTILSLYLIGKRMFSKRTALIACFLYAFSPLILQLSHMPYHTTPIPFFTLVYFYSLYRWVKGNNKFLPFSFLLLGILYNFELATIMLIGPLSIVSLYGWWKKKAWIRTISRKEILLSAIAAAVPMLPVLIYDTTHGFRQTAVYGAWIVLTAFRSIIGVFSHSGQSSNTTIPFLLERMSWLIFLSNYFIGSVFFLLILLFLGIKVVRDYRQKVLSISVILLTLYLFISLIAFIGNRTPSDAYLPIIFPAVILAMGVVLESLFKRYRFFTLFVILIIVVLNMTIYIKHNYSILEGNQIGLTDQEKIVMRMITSSRGNEFRLIGKGPGSQFRSFTMPYEYLLWYKGHPVAIQAKDRFTIEENENGITLHHD